MSAATIRKAHAIHPLTAVQTEYSLFERNVEEDGILDTLNELGIGFIAYSPLGRGFISGKIKSPDDFPENDFRKSIPKFQGEQFNKNIELVDEIKNLAEQKGISTIQLALAWVISKGFVPIPGTKRRKYVEQNIEATNITLTAEELSKLESIIPLGTITGDRYDATTMATIDK